MHRRMIAAGHTLVTEYKTPYHMIDEWRSRWHPESRVQRAQAH